MGSFDEDFDRLSAADADDVAWLEATLRSQVEPQDWPYWGIRLIKRIRSHEEFVRDLLEAVRKRGSRPSQSWLAPELSALEAAIPKDVQRGQELGAADEDGGQDV